MKNVVYIIIDNKSSRIFRVFENYSSACIYKEQLVASYPFLEIKKFEVN